MRLVPLEVVFAQRPRAFYILDVRLSLYSSAKLEPVRFAREPIMQNVIIKELINNEPIINGI